MDASSNELSTKRPVPNWCIALFAALTTFGLPAFASEEHWLELVQACEAVISEQSFAPLESYEPAPFSKGLPGIKEYSAYSVTENLVAIARITKGEWVYCFVRESEESRLRWRKLAGEWTKRFDDAYPRPEYHWVKWPYDPRTPFRGAVRCRKEKNPITIKPLLSDFHFRVIVSGLISRSSMELCDP